jgi:hypothetical protein
VRRDRYTLAPSIWRCPSGSVEEIAFGYTSGSEQFAASAKALLCQIAIDLAEYCLALVRVGGVNPVRLHIVTIFQHGAGIVANLAERPKISVSFVPNVFIAHMMHFVGRRFAEDAETMVEF